MKHDHILHTSRLTGLTDGVFAIAMTLLVVEVRLPSYAPEANLPTIIYSNILQHILIYAGSFIILGTQWISINFQHGFLHRVNRYYLWSNIIYLMMVGIIPFSAHLLINFPDSMTSIFFYSLNLFGCSLALLLVWQCGALYKIYSHEYNDLARRVVFYRLSVPPLFYILSIIVSQWYPHVAFVILTLPPLFYLIPGKLDRYISKEE